MSEPKKTESFAGNVMKYSIATYLGFGISGAALIIKGVLPAESYAVPASFMAYTMSLMNVGMLGLDQSLLRFYHEPSAGSTGRSMFAACTRLSVLVMLLAGGIGNLIDRVLNGEVVDYINPLFIDFAVFNFADICVCVGVALWVLVILLEEVEDKPSKEQ